jgi:SPX domain protein involved in polyphosphate accumulation
MLRGRHFVDFHGEMLLLVHWSILAYTGLVKILKKHHKRTGLRVRAPHLDNLLNQPFCSVEVTSPDACSRWPVARTRRPVLP